ncbi:hypothetical protein T492DRAFT_870200 [Pavlovales sp. CCMP2436]|nr:hypothetical protein T492DRAFT_870200 [Pavlovales sp. CCMP2436]
MLCWSERCVAHCLLRALVGYAGLGATARADGSPLQRAKFPSLEAARAPEAPATCPAAAVVVVVLEVLIVVSACSLPPRAATPALLAGSRIVVNAQYDEAVGRGPDDELAVEPGAKRGRRVHLGALHFMESLRLDDNKANDEDSSGDDADDGRDEAAEDDEAYEQDEEQAHAIGFSWAARKGGMERARERDQVTQGHTEDLQDEREDIQHIIITHFNRGVDPVADALYDYVEHFAYYQPKQAQRGRHSSRALHIRLLFAEIDNINAEIRQIRATRRTERIERAQTQFAQESEHLRTGPFPDPSSYDYDYDSFADGLEPTRESLGCELRTRRRLPTPGNGEEGEASTGSDDDMYALMSVSPMEAAARIKKQLIDTIGTIAARGHAQLLLARLSALAPIAAQRGNTTNSNQQIISLNALARA